MYNEELETLIDAALADGVLTEKEKQILFKKAQTMGIDLDEFEMVLDARLVKLQKAEQEKAASSAPKSNKFGDVKKCPACGAIVSSLSGVCAECGFEFTGVDANLSSKMLAKKIDELLDEENKKKEELRKRSKKTRLSPEDDYWEDIKARWGIEKDFNTRIEATIEHFAIPTTKSDLFEFIVFLKAKINNNGKYKRAFRAKLDECFDKVKFVFPNDPIFKSLLEEEQKKNEEERKEKERRRKRKRQNKRMYVVLVFITICIMVAECCFLQWPVEWRILLALGTASLLLGIGAAVIFTRK